VIRAFAHDRFTYPLPADHRFPLGRYRMLREAIEEQGIAQVEEAPGAEDADLLLAHDPRYLDRVVHGRLTDREQKAVGLPWSPELVERGRRSVGATLAAAAAAVDDGTGINLGGARTMPSPMPAGGSAPSTTLRWPCAASASMG